MVGFQWPQKGPHVVATMQPQAHYTTAAVMSYGTVPGAVCCMLHGRSAGHSPPQGGTICGNFCWRSCSSHRDLQSYDSGSGSHPAAGAAARQQRRKNVPEIIRSRTERPEDAPLNRRVDVHVNGKFFMRLLDLEHVFSEHASNLN